ncbi:peptidase M28-like protein [Tahibacter aquaticus]|uniref:Peptidase M28-like protein n=1 Tax=Tahibacter aquaticus TaxID=520092 RepID=A0A4R6Z7Y5_9GAMM|nr:M28 family peptidase [Tahibacter aquaticus]TDR47719.1 peptidase M28-like protein [Tahibacter aquaticus]
MRLRHRLVVWSLFAGLVVAAVATVVQPRVVPLPSQPPAVDVARLQADVKHLSVDLYPRSYDHFENIDRAAQFIRDEFARTGGTVSEQPVAVQGVTYRNIVLRFGPELGPLLVIGAHYDSHGDVQLARRNAGGVSPYTHTPGADDNASGTAGLLELARLLGRNPPRRPVELVAYTLEEPPFFRTEDMGSAWHARALKAAGREVELMLSLEMIGYFSDQPGSQHYPAPGMASLYSDRGDFILLAGRMGDFGAIRHVKAVMAGASDLPVHSINAPPLLQGIDFSDHLNYWREGYPALMITDTAFMRNPHYHRDSDTFEKLDYVRVGKVVQAVYALTHI